MAGKVRRCVGQQIVQLRGERLARGLWQTWGTLYHIGSDGLRGPDLQAQFHASCQRTVIVQIPHFLGIRRVLGEPQWFAINRH